MKKTSIGEVELAYEVIGSGTPLIQIHGAGFGHRNFAALSPFLKDHFLVIDVDLRGFGESDRPIQEYTFEGWANDVARFMDALEIQRAHVHGSSMGGAVAITLAARHPDRLLGLVVSCTLAKPDTYARTSFELMRSLARTYGLGSEELARFNALLALSRGYLDGPDGPGAIRTIQDVLETTNSPEIFDQAWQRLIEMDIESLLSEVGAPTLVMAASEDHMMTPATMAGDGKGTLDIVRAIAQSELVVIQGSSHSHLLERPAESATAMIGFLRRVEILVHARGAH